jgi:plastocyanin
LGAGGVAAGLTHLPLARAAGPAATIRLMSDELGEKVWFDPIGLWVAPGTRITWVNVSNVHTVAAYHPKNGNRMPRIPTGATPFASDYLVEPGARFSVTLTVPGVYDYFCEPHEAAGMVGRIVVGAPAGGPGTRGFAIPAGKGWRPVPPAARKAFPPVAEIMSKRVVRHG